MSLSILQTAGGAILGSHPPSPHNRLEMQHSTFLKWTSKSNKSGEKHFWMPRMWNQSGGDVTEETSEKQQGSLFPFASPRLSPPASPPSVLILFAGLRGKVGQLPRQGLLGKCGCCQAAVAAVSHTALFCQRPGFRLYDQTRPSADQSPAHLTLLAPLHGLSLRHTHIFVFSDTHTHKGALTRLARHSAKDFLPNIRQLPWQRASEPRIMTHSRSQMCHICSHEGGSVCVCMCVCRSGGLPVLNGGWGSNREDRALSLTCTSK